MEWVNEDIFKLIVISVAFVFFYLKAKAGNIAPLNRFLISAGLLLLFSAAFLDFTDGLEAFQNTPILGRSDPWHDILEDQVFDTPGLVLLLWGSFREMKL